MEALDLTIAAAAAHPQVEEAALAVLCDLPAPIAVNMAIRFEQAFSSTAEAWRFMQVERDAAPTQSTTSWYPVS